MRGDIDWLVYSNRIAYANNYNAIINTFVGAEDREVPGSSPTQD